MLALTQPQVVLGLVAGLASGLAHLEQVHISEMANVFGES